MFAFVIWAIGIYIMFRLSMFNLVVVGAAFEHHWFLGLLAISASSWMDITDCLSPRLTCLDV